LQLANHMQTDQKARDFDFKQGHDSTFRPSLAHPFKDSLYLPWQYLAVGLS